MKHNSDNARINTLGTKDNSNLEELFRRSEISSKNKESKKDTSCLLCEHINICKWCEEMKSTYDYVEDKFNINDSSPIKIIISCDSFKRK